MSKSNIETLGLDEALLNLAEQISASEIPIEETSLTSFDNFVQNIFTLSYPNYSFRSWHIRKICDFIDEVLASESKMAEVVLPRYHLKSTVIGYGLSIYRMLKSFGDGLYISYKDELTNFHLSNIKTAISVNPKLSKFMVDIHPRSESAIAYKIGSRRIRLFGSGIFAMKRGLHTDLICIADDLIGTVENPMVLTELEKAERIFNQEVINIPNKDCPLIVYGTTIDYTDLLFKLKDNPQFATLWLPAINPDPQHEVLWEDKFDRKTLEMKKQQGGWKAFSSEFLLTPVLSMEAFFTRDELDKVIDKNLVNYHVPGG